MADPLEAIIRPVVEGQLRSFTYDHPEVVEAVDWFKPRKDKRVTFVNSIAKRIVRDLLGAGNRARLVQAVAAMGSGEADEGAPPLAAARVGGTLPPTGGRGHYDSSSAPTLLTEQEAAEALR